MGWVDWGEPLRIGATVLRVLRPRPAEDAGALPSEVDRAITRPAAKATIEVIEGIDRPVRWEMKRLLALVGGAAPCKVRLRDPRVSRFHCALVRGPLGVWAVNLLSRDGTRVNGSGVPWSRLTGGDRLQVGPYTLRVRYERPADNRIAERTPAPVALSVFQTAPPTSTRAGADHSLLLPVINEINRMQQQMLEQFHQTTLMMAEMFSSLHREQMGLVREELGQLRGSPRNYRACEPSGHVWPWKDRTPRRRKPRRPTPRKVARPRAACAESAARRGNAGRLIRGGSSGGRGGKGSRTGAGHARGPRRGGRPRLAQSTDRLAGRGRSGRWQKFLQFIMGGNRS